VYSTLRWLVSALNQSIKQFGRKASEESRSEPICSTNLFFHSLLALSGTGLPLLNAIARRLFILVFLDILIFDLV